MNALSQYSEGRDNNFNIIRIIAAILVMFSHSFALAQGRKFIDPLQTLTDLSMGSLAVDIFFVSSGFLVTASLFRTATPLRFLWHRVLRIYPALIIAIVFCVFVIGLTFTKLSAHAYLSNANIYTYLWKNSFLFFGYERYLPAVFIDIPYGRAVNSSLWTLPWEVRMYALLFLLACTQYYLKLLNRVWLERIIIIIAVISMPTYLCDRFLPFISDINLKNGLRLQALFFAGATAFILRDFINLSMKLALTILAGLVALAFFYAEAFYPLYFICLPWLVLVFAYIPTGKIRLFNGVGDYSYGIYIYAFPIQQATMSLMRGLSVYELTLIALIVSLCFAAASWHLIEKPMLAKKNLQL